MADSDTPDPPDQPRARRRPGPAREARAWRSRTTANLLFERSETFGSTVAGETRSLAVIATIASWLIIAVYLWFRFKSLVYGLAAIIAVVHDVLDHPGRRRRHLLAVA